MSGVAEVMKSPELTRKIVNIYSFLSTERLQYDLEFGEFCSTSPRRSNFLTYLVGKLTNVTWSWIDPVGQREKNSEEKTMRSEAWEPVFNKRTDDVIFMYESTDGFSIDTKMSVCCHIYSLAFSHNYVSIYQFFFCYHILWWNDPKVVQPVGWMNTSSAPVEMSPLTFSADHRGPGGVPQKQINGAFKKRHHRNHRVVFRLSFPLSFRFADFKLVDCECLCWFVTNCSIWGAIQVGEDLHSGAWSF